MFLLIGVSIFIPFSVSALTFDDGTTVTKENYHLYIREYRKKDNKYKDYNYCAFIINNSYIRTFCSKQPMYVNNSDISKASLYSKEVNNISYYYDYKESISFNEIINTLLVYNSVSDYVFDHDLYTEDNILVKEQSIFYNDIDYHNLTFTSSLSGYSVVVRDSNNTIINPTNNIYKLQSSKEYSYVATRSGYKNIEGTITLTQDKEIKLNFIPYVDTSSIISIYSDFLNTLKSMVSVIYESQLILFLIGVILVYALVYLIINLLGGRL